MRYVIDASVAVKWYVPEIHDSYASTLQIDGSDLHAPELIVPEFANIVWKKIRLGELTQAEGSRIVKAFGAARVKLHSHGGLAMSAFTGAYLTQQTVYDWTYLSLAIAMSCLFVTADARFYRSLQTTAVSKNLIWIEDI